MIREAHDPRNKSQRKVPYNSENGERDILSSKNAYLAPIMCIFLAQVTDVQIAYPKQVLLLLLV